MSDVVGAISAVNAPREVSRVDLSAQLQRAEKQLSACVNCASADTREGKADIDRLSSLVARLKQRMEGLDQQRATVESPAPSGSGGRARTRIDTYA